MTVTEALKISNKILFISAFVFLATFATALHAQTRVSVGFDYGIIGEANTNAHQPERGVLLSSLGVTQVVISQLSDNGEFGGSQGNDYDVDVTFLFEDGTSTTFLGAVNWRDTSGSTVIGIGIIGATANPLDGTSYSPSVGYYTSYLFRFVGSTKTYSETDLGIKIPEVSGNAATQGLLDALNAYASLSPASNDPSPLTSTISASPNSIDADGTSTAQVTVQLKDVNGNNLTTSGGTVVLSTDLGTLGTVTDNNDGTYTAILTSSTTAGTATISGTLAGANLSNTATVAMTVGTAAAEFNENHSAILSIVQADAARSLRSTLSLNRQMASDARSRFSERFVTRSLCNSDPEASDPVQSYDGIWCDDIPFDIEGSFIATRDGISTQGSFFQQSGDAETGTRRLIFGDFLVQRDEESGSTTATLDARVAWERMVDDATMLGYFIGAELAHSNLEGSFAGDQDRYGMTVGAYAVHALSESLFVDGYATLGAGQNELEASNGVLALESDYSTWTVSVGGALTGVISQPGYDFLPELAFNYGRTQIGQVGFTGTAYGVVDNTLSLDAGDVSIASLTFRPEIQVSMDGGPVARAETVFSFSPRLICEEVRMATTSSDCGTGLELGLSSAYNDGLGSLDMRLMRDWVGDATRTSFRLQFEHSF